jgi:hypothetical protein
MSDERLRELERSWRVSRSLTDWLLWARAADRAGHREPLQFWKALSRIPLLQARVTRIRTLVHLQGWPLTSPSRRPENYREAMSQQAEMLSRRLMHAQRRALEVVQRVLFRLERADLLPPLPLEARLPRGAGPFPDARMYEALRQRRPEAGSSLRLAGILYHAREERVLYQEARRAKLAMREGWSRDVTCRVCRGTGLVRLPLQHEQGESCRACRGTGVSDPPALLPQPPTAVSGSAESPRVWPCPRHGPTCGTASGDLIPTLDPLAHCTHPSQRPAQLVCRRHGARCRPAPLQDGTVVLPILNSMAPCRHGYGAGQAAPPAEPAEPGDPDYF